MGISLNVTTTSKGKLRDFATAATAHSIDLKPLPGLASITAPEENGETFEANAMLKAIYYSQYAPSELVLADDSGLEVDALGGAPGVRSARFAADSGITDSPDANDNTDVWNNIVLLQKLAGIAIEKRTARYRCVLALARDGEAAANRRQAQSKDSSLKLRVVTAASATTRSSSSPRSTRPWPRLTLKPNSPSAIADVR